jgi:hypothetical protein
MRPLLLLLYGSLARCSYVLQSIVPSCGSSSTAGHAWVQDSCSFTGGYEYQSWSCNATHAALSQFDGPCQGRPWGVQHFPIGCTKGLRTECGVDLTDLDAGMQKPFVATDHRLNNSGTCEGAITFRTAVAVGICTATPADGCGDRVLTNVSDSTATTQCFINQPGMSGQCNKEILNHVTHTQLNHCAVTNQTTPFAGVAYSTAWTQLSSALLLVGASV